MYSKLQNLIKASFYLAVICVATLVFCEFALFCMDRAGVMPRVFERLKIAEYSFDQENASGLYYAHPYNAYEMVPSYQKNGWAHINSLGFRGNEFNFQKPSDLYRIVALGASQTYGIYNPYDQTYPYLLEQQLRKSLVTDRIEVINAGLVSASTMESLVRFYLKVLELQPDMILIYDGFSDVAPRVFNNFKSDYSHFRKILKGEDSLISRLYLGRLLEVTFGVLSQKGVQNANLLNYTWKMENLPNEDRDRIANFEKNGPEVFRRNIEQIVIAALGNKIRPVLSTFAYAGELGRWTDTIPKELWEPGIRQHNAVLKDIATSYDIPLCDFFEEAEKDIKIFSKDSIHFSDYGNAKLAYCFRRLIEPEIVSKFRQRNSTASSTFK